MQTSPEVCRYRAHWSCRPQQKLLWTFEDLADLWRNPFLQITTNVLQAQASEEVIDLHRGFEVQPSTKVSLYDMGYSKTRWVLPGKNGNPKKFTSAMPDTKQQYLHHIDALAQLLLSAIISKNVA